MNTYTINLYFGFKRKWCLYCTNTIEEANNFANSWAKCYCPGPTEIKVIRSPEQMK